MLGGKTRLSHVGRHAMALPVLISIALTSDGNIASAHDQISAEDCARLAPAEQSIVVAQSKLSDEKLSKALAESGVGLKPIAVATEYVPDLAEQPVAAVPDLADPPAKQHPRANSASYVASRAKSEQLPIDPEVLTFNGIAPGISTRINVLRTLGDPRTEDTTADVFEYRFEKLRSILVHFDGDLVDTITIKLPGPVSVAKLEKQLAIASIRPTLITDASGKPHARSYPERGVVLVLADGISPRAGAESLGFVSKVIVQPIKADSFLLRAENEMNSNLTNAISDLREVLKLNHDCAEAKWQLSKLLLRTGQAVAAEHMAAEAVESAPRNGAFQLQHAKCLRQLARYDRASVAVREVLDVEDQTTLLRSQALYELGLLASFGSAEVSKQAVPLLTKAIELADTLANDPNLDTRRQASELLVMAHLDMAVLISKGDWEEKEQTVPQWIERASALSEGLIAKNEKNLWMRLQVAITALAAAANMDPPVASDLWIEEAELTAALLSESTSDPQLRDVYDWSLGLAYFQAAQIEHRRSKPDMALQLAEFAEEKLADLSKRRDELPDTAYLMGRLYFQIGAVHAIHFEDHEEACSWYDRAASLLINPVPVTTMAGPQQHGDALVSMGVSYWSVGSRQRSVELTQAGVDLIEEGVENGILASSALAIPYGNLAAMYEARGESGPAAKYNRLAKSITGTQAR